MILEKHILNGNLAGAYLVVGSVAQIREIGENFAKNFKVADVFWLCRREDEASIKVEHVLPFLDITLLAPIGDKKVMLIHDAATMTPAAQNKLLKTLEETGDHTVFMLLASSIDRIVSTIRSRCVTIFAPTVKKENPMAGKVKELLACKTLDEALPLLPKLTSRDNIMDTLSALSTIVKEYDTLTTLAQINRNIQANCNPTNAFDLFIMRYFKK